MKTSRSKRERPARRGRSPLPEAERKARLIQTRVDDQLDSALRAAARQRRVTVSQLIRNVLEDAFQLVARAKPRTRPLDEIEAWQDVVTVGRQAACEQCLELLNRGDKALIGVSDDPSAARVGLRRSAQRTRAHLVARKHTPFDYVVLQHLRSPGPGHAIAQQAAFPVMVQLEQPPWVPCGAPGISRNCPHLSERRVALRAGLILSRSMYDAAALDRCVHEFEIALRHLAHPHHPRTRRQRAAPGPHPPQCRALMTRPRAPVPLVRSGPVPYCQLG